MDRWLVGLIAGFALLFLADGLLVWLALQGAPEIEASYEARVGEGP